MVIIHMIASLLRVLIGLAIAVPVGVSLGIICAYRGRILLSIFRFLTPVPKIIFLPFLMILFGVGTISQITIIVLVPVFPLIISVATAVKNVPREYFEPFIVAGKSRAFMLFNIILPSTSDAVTGSVKSAVAAAFSVLIFAESFGTKYGIGYYIMDMWQRLEYPQMALGTVLTAACGVAVCRVCDLLTSRK